MNFLRICLISSVAALSVSACGSDPVSVPGTNPTIDPSPRTLKPVGSDTEFYTALSQALKSQTTGYGSVASVREELDSVAAPVTGNSTTDGGSSGNETTSTNVQELGVDEQDWVKQNAAGDQLFVLKSEYNSNYTPEPVIDGPALRARSSIALPQSYTSQLRILSLDDETPDSTSVTDFDLNMEGRYAQGFYLYENAGNASVYVTASGTNYWSFWNDSAAFTGVDSLITRVNVSNSATPAIDASFALDGQMVSSRRIGKHLFFVSRYYPTLPGNQPWAQSAADWAAQVDSTDLSTVLPKYYLNGSDIGAQLITPSQCFVADNSASDSYYSPDIITLGVIDLETMQLSDSECFLGATETLYASANAIFLATTRYDYSSGPVDDSGTAIDTDNVDLPVDIIWRDPRVDTDIHQFDIHSGQLSYEGSGKVDGHLGWNALRKPFRMSEQNGYLRVATMNDEQGPGHSPILMTVLKSNGQGALEAVSSLPNTQKTAHIGKPGEQLYASRFVGNRAYLVTFRQTDPLYVIDLTEPANPGIAGELEIEGYSDYLHPVSENYLLGIGRDAYAAGDRGALVQGMKLSLFDVSDPVAPTEIQSMLIGQRGTHSASLNDHRAIGIQAATDAHPLRVSFGIDVYGDIGGARPTDIESATRYYDYNYSGLHGFDVRVGADAEIISRGVLRVDASNPFGSGYGQDRSVMLNDAVYYIRDSKVYAAHWDDLSNSSLAR
ncbi:MAG: beta-propeller domain-containing protein [Granulosicoccus sp.]